MLPASSIDTIRETETATKRMDFNYQIKPLKIKKKRKR